MNRICSGLNRITLMVARPPHILLKNPLQMFFSRSIGDGVFNTPDDIKEPTLPEYTERTGETVDIKRARIMYQSRKRGMLENDLLLSSFADRYLPELSESQLNMYDKIINKPNNDWDIFNWITGKVEVPEEFSNEVMDMIKEHSKNIDMEDRTRMPDLK